MTAASGDTLARPKVPAGAGRMKSLVRVSRYLALRKVSLGAVMVLFLIGTVSFIALSVMLGIAVNSLTVTSSTGNIYHIVLIMAGMSALSFICYYIGYYLLADVTQTALFRLRQDLFEHMQTLSLRFYDRQPIGELMSRVTNDIDVVTAFFQQPLVSCQQYTVVKYLMD